LSLRATLRRVQLFGVAIAAASLALALLGCEPKALPEQGSTAEQLYAGRCGGCHRPYNPESLTAAMWHVQIEAMQVKMAQAGVAPLTEAERHTIIDYLERNAGHE
jgi:mono/diheme cytochrome c family protein